ncbi:SCO2525 family SAM-dependent methyltransferase [Streptomyces sp. Tu102]|uniref:SCO2525 family SAM-dependent methyltransferase n=1 Tax=Streptomyces sp. Tu102 TaxID=2838019 RepID=UPI0027E4DC1C|nr:SCO2525 family SAM-dependent methyltransferase [Streptomyces sp. Tu102]
MSGAKREPGPDALAYGRELRKIFLRLGRSQNEVAGLLAIDPSVLSRFFSGKPSKDSAADTIAAKEHADALIRLVRNSGASVTDAEVAKLHDLRRVAQAASRRRDAVVDSFREQLGILQVEVESCRGELEGARLGNTRLVERFERMSQQLREAKQRCEQAEARAEETTTRLVQAVQLRDEAEAAAAENREKLLAATRYARESEAQLETQREELRQLRQEIGVLRRQVQSLTAEAGVSAREPLADVATQVSAAQSSSGATSVHRSGRRADDLNVEASWDLFDPVAYVSYNYQGMLAEDEEIVSLVREHFSHHFECRDRELSGIDVGSGPNLYPALIMLPWVREITLLELSTSNLQYLNNQLPSYDSHWDQFWHALCRGSRGSAYADLGDPRELFRRSVSVRHGTLFDLVSDPGRWDVGTMFFVAESITRSIVEFRRGVDCFVSSLKPGAPFAAAFMENSEGYSVGEVEFPACSVGAAEVGEVFRGIAEEITVHRIGASQGIRPGYSGMLLVCGRRR